MKKILLYTDTPQVGGAELQMFLLAKFLNKEFFTPILACSNFSSLDKWCENFEKENIKVIRLEVKHKHDPRHFFRLKKILKEEKIDLLHIHVWNPASGRYAFLAGKSAKIPVVITEHDPFELSTLKNIFKKNTLKSVKKIITVSENNAKLLKKLYPEQISKIKVIHNGIDITWWQSQFLRFTDEDYTETKEKIFNADKSTLIIITVAELHERKGLDIVIEAMKTVVEKFPNTKLIIIGEGPDRKNFENLIKKLDLSEHIELLGRKKEIPKLLKSADIFVLPSRREAFGMVLLEAAMASLPIIAADTGGIPEIIENGKNGLLFGKENSAELSKKLIELISSPAKRKKLAETGEMEIQKNFTAKKMAEAYGKIYKSLEKN